MIFLIQYHRPKGQLIKLQGFADTERELANRTRLKLELDSIGRESDTEIIILESRSEEILRRTHRRYFETAEQLLDAARSEINSIEFNGNGPGNGKNGS
jgi:hypothetical protein